MAKARRRHIGISLGSTLLVAALAVTLAFTVAGLGVSHLNAAARLENSVIARNLAEAAVSRALEQTIYSDLDYGSHGSETMVVSFPNQVGNGTVTFGASLPNLPKSTYNLGKDTSTTGSLDRVVPSESLHLIGLGSCNGVERRLEVIVHIPTFPYAVASEGPVNATGAMLVAGAANTSDALPVSASNPKLTQSHLVSNGAGNNSISFDSTAGSILVKGYARATGMIAKDDPNRVTIEGGERQGSDKAAIPEVNISEFDPANFTDPGRLQDVPATGMVRKGGLFKHNGNLVLDSLDMPVDGDGAIIYVNGDLTINEGVKGTGLIVATGNLTIKGAGTSNVTAENTAALLAGKSLSLQGSDPNFSFFKGLLYSREQSHIKDVTVFGPVVKGGDATTSMNLENANNINLEQTLKFQFSMPFQAGNGVGGVDIRLGQKSGGQTYKLQDFYNESTRHYDKPVNATHLGYFNPQDGSYFAGPTQAAAFALSKPPPDPPGSWSAFLLGYPGGSDQERMEYYLENVAVPQSINNLNEDLLKIDNWYQSHVVQPKDKGTINMDPTAFLPLDRRMKIIMWREF